MVVVDEEFQRRVSSRAKQPRRTWASRRELHEHLRRHQTAGRWREDVIRDVVEHEAMDLADGTVDMKWATAMMDWREREGDDLDLRPVLSGLDLPILFIVSEQRRHVFDGVHVLGEKKLPEFRMLTVARTEHNMYMERPDAVSRAIEGFATCGPLPATI